MKKIILLAVICSVFVGVSMAVTLYILNGGRSSSASAQSTAGSTSHNMPPGMSHEEHQKLLAEEATKQGGGQGASTSDKPMEHNMPPGMSHEDHQKMMAEAAKQQSVGQGAATTAKPADHPNMQGGMDHSMPMGMSHEEHQKMMAGAEKKQSGNQAASGDKPMDHSSMPAGTAHNMPSGMSHEEHQKMMAAAAKQNGGQDVASDKPMDHSDMPAGMAHNMPPGMSHADHMKAMAAQGHDHHPGQEDSADPRPEFRAIKSLTADEIQAYEEGTGHGMAKAAEQNHYPGPRHLLDLAKELQLSQDQIREIQKIKGSMSSAAITTGKQLIENERKLNRLFADKNIDQTQLAAVVAESASLQGKLRAIHLSAHLQAQKLLSGAQIDKYDELRGYKSATNASADAHHEHSMQ